MHLARRRGDHDVVGLGQRAPAREGLAVGRQREGHRAPDLLGVGRDAHREEAVERERIGPAQRLQALLAPRARSICAQGDVALLGAAERAQLSAPSSSRASTGTHSHARVVVQRARRRRSAVGEARSKKKAGRLSRG